jgi:exosome complex component RRP40
MASAAVVGDTVLPGDVINYDFLNTEQRTKIVLGPGLRQQAEAIVVTKPGVLRSREPAMLWVDSHQKRVS